MQGYSSDLGEVEVRLTDVVEPSRVATAALHQQGEAGDAFKARGESTQKAWQKNFFHVDGMRPDGVRVTQSSLVTIQAGDTRMQNYAFNPEIARTYDGILGFGVPPFAHSGGAAREAALQASTHLQVQDPLCRELLSSRPTGPQGGRRHDGVKSVCDNAVQSCTVGI